MHMMTCVETTLTGGLNLKKTVINDNTNITNFLIGNGIGYSIPAK